MKIASVRNTVEIGRSNGYGTIRFDATMGPPG